MAKLTPQEFAEKWARRLQGSTQDIRQGIERVTEAPGEKAAAAQDALLLNFTESVNSGRWAASVRNVSLADWKKAALDKGVARIPAGVEAATPKMASIAAELLPAVDAAAEAAKRMPNTTFDDRIQRMVTFAREMHERAPKRRRS